MVHEKYQDPIAVSIIYRGKAIMPKAFEWANKTYSISRVLNVHSTWEGREPVHYFSVANDTEFFKLAFYGESLTWYIIEHFQE